MDRFEAAALDAHITGNHQPCVAKPPTYVLNIAGARLP